MRKIAVFIGVIVLGATVAASAQVVNREQYRHWFSSNDAYSQGFRAGYEAAVGDMTRAAYGNPGVITQGAIWCVQTRPVPYLQQLAGIALQQWLAVNNPRVPAAVQILSAYNTCQGEEDQPGPGYDRK